MTPDEKPTLLFWKVQAGVWSLYAIALMVPWMGEYPVMAMLPNKVVVGGSGLLVSSLLRYAYRGLMRRHVRIQVLVAAALVACAVGGVAWDLLLAELLGVTQRDGLRALGTLDGGVPRFDGALHRGLVLVAWSLSYLGVRHYRDLLTERETSFLVRASAREARLQALQYQIGPHFLFNSLNAVSTLIVTGRGNDATEMLARISDMLRLSLDPGGSMDTLVSLQRELELTRNYLEIEKVRFGDRLRVRIEVGEGALAARVPALILQPLVENAIRHVVAQREQPTTVTISAALREDSLTVSVADDGDGVSAGAAGIGVGLTNTRSRLLELYGAAHRFERKASESGGTQIVFVVPMRAAASANAGGLS